MQKYEVTQIVAKSSLEEVLTDFFNKYPEVKNSVPYMRRGTFTRETIQFFIRTRIFDLIGALNLPGPSAPSRLCLKAALLYEKNFCPTLEKNHYLRDMSDPDHIKAVANELEMSLQVAGVLISVLQNHNLPLEICFKILFYAETDLAEIPRILWEDKIKIEEPILNTQQKAASPKIMRYSQRNLLINEMAREPLPRNPLNKKRIEDVTIYEVTKRPDL